MNKNGLIFIFACVAAICGYWVQENNRSHEVSKQIISPPSKHSVNTVSVEPKAAHSAIYSAYLNKQSNVQVEGEGEVKAILKDDLTGSRHQKFILDLQNGLTVLIAHNIDLAPRLDGLQKGDRVQFHGEYKYNEKGGVVHWTHHDPSQRHANGWLKWKGQIYQ
ncbi:DUF3465 domain-containing protein [Acinetobacter sp. MD2]|uniref:DUF3465 domain-containing protein n=1 Tax=Acinetobacter sp. MD2 TaxID=2600066 RepID=UPI002D1E9606|nr:DUF3465 domain-containing protein [Acinetobacter sp. MD2]MEB3766169.1 DUF3465 domain-containing protein [Acinetobacter sp. MD2]